MGYVKNYNVGQIRVDLPTPNYFHELPLISFGDIHGSMSLSLVFNYGMKVENRNHFHIAAGYKLNLQKRLIMSGGVPYKLVDERGKQIVLNEIDSVYTLDDDSQRILRKDGTYYMLYNPDQSREWYDSSGKLVDLIDKYGVTVLSYDYNTSGKLTSISYRGKTISFAYDNQNRLITIKNDRKYIDFTYTETGIQLEHYNGVTFSLALSGTNFTATATATENSTTVTYTTKIERPAGYLNILKITNLVGSEIVDQTAYNFSSAIIDEGVIDYTFKHKHVDITDRRGMKTRVQYQREAPLYSYEIDSSGNFPGGSVTVFNTVDASDNGSVSGEFNKNIGIGMTLMPSNQAWLYNAVNYEGANQEGYYVVSGWIRLLGDCAQPTMIVSSGLTTRNFDFFPYAATDGSWRFFAYKFSINANNIYLRPENPSSSELKDVRIVFNPLSETYNKQGGRFSLSEDVLIYHGGSGYQYIPFEKAEFTCGGENLSYYGRVCFEDVLKYKLNRKKGDHTDEIYYDRCKNIMRSSSELRVTYNGTASSIDNFYLGKRRVTSVKTVEESNQTQQIPVKIITTVYKDDTDSFLVCDVIDSGNTVLSSQIYNDYLDVVSTTADGVTTVYTRDNDLILSESVDGLYTRTTTYGTDANECPTITTVNEFNKTTVYTLDSEWGNVKSITLPDGQVVTDEYDSGACAKLSRTFSTGGRSNIYGYFGGNLSRLQSGNLVYDFTYDKGNLSAVNKNGDQTEEHEISNTRSDSYYPAKLGAVYSDKATFDKYGRLVSIEGALTNTYDEAPSCVSNVYGVSGKDNASGKLATCTDLTTGNVRKYAYDVDNLSKTATFNSSGTKISEDDITYDDINRVIEVKYDNVSDSHSVKETQSYTVAATAANADNRLAQSKFYVGGINRVTSTNTYDDYKRLSAKTIKVGGYQVKKNYSYNKTRLNAITHVQNGETKHKYGMQFDSAQRIITVRDSIVGGYSNTYGYDAYGQLIRENNDILNKTILYTYDNIGNITAAQTYNYTLNDVSGAPTEEDTYTYSASYPDRLTIFNGKGITYDALGCVKTYDGWTYTWNKGKLSAMRKGPANSAAIAPSEAYTFAYNALGQRIEKKYTFSANASQTIDYLASCTSTYEYDLSGRLIREKRVSKYSDGVTITRVFSYLYEGSEIVGLIYNNGSTAVPYYYDKNPSGDVVAILDSTGTAVVKYNYDAWGNCSWLESTNNDLAQSNSIRYRSYCYDEDTGLYYLNARYYNPQWRRFISPDSTEYLDPETPNGLNLYAYCGNDPVNCKQSPISSVGSVIISSISAGGSSVSVGESSVGGNLSGMGNPSAPWWTSTAVGAIPDFILGMRYLAASGMHSKFAYATKTRYMHPIMGGTWRWFSKSSSSFGTIAQGTFKQILTGDARAGFGAIAKSVGGVVGLNALVNFGFNFYENNWQVDAAMLMDTAIDTAIGVSSYYLAAGMMSLATAGLLTAGVSLPGIVIVGGVVILSIGFEHLIRAISGYWD